MTMFRLPVRKALAKVSSPLFRFVMLYSSPFASRRLRSPKVKSPFFDVWSLQSMKTGYVLTKRCMNCSIAAAVRSAGVWYTWYICGQFCTSFPLIEKGMTIGMLLDIQKSASPLTCAV